MSQTKIVFRIIKPAFAIVDTAYPPIRATRLWMTRAFADLPISQQNGWYSALPSFVDI